MHSTENPHIPIVAFKAVSCIVSVCVRVTKSERVGDFVCGFKYVTVFHGHACPACSCFVCSHMLVLVILFTLNFTCQTQKSDVQSHRSSVLVPRLTVTRAQVFVLKGKRYKGRI